MTQRPIWWLGVSNIGPTDRAPPGDPYGDGPGEDLVLDRSWHREDSGNVEGAAANECFCPAVQVMFGSPPIVASEKQVLN